MSERRRQQPQGRCQLFFARRRTNLCSFAAVGTGIASAVSSGFGGSSILGATSAAGDSSALTVSTTWGTSSTFGFFRPGFYRLRFFRIGLDLDRLW